MSGFDIVSDAEASFDVAGSDDPQGHGYTWNCYQGTSDPQQQNYSRWARPPDSRSFSSQFGSRTNHGTAAEYPVAPSEPYPQSQQDDFWAEEGREPGYNCEHESNSAPWICDEHSASQVITGNVPADADADTGHWNTQGDNHRNQGCPVSVNEATGGPSDYDYGSTRERRQPNRRDIIVEHVLSNLTPRILDMLEKEFERLETCKGRDGTRPSSEFGDYDEDKVGPEDLKL